MSETKKKFTILGFSVWRLLAYFVIYSVIGYVVEIIFGMITKGVIESRQSFLYGPFCGIYGLGAVIMIIFLQYFSKNNNSLFFGGFIIGSIVEYVVSLLGELILNIRWWDYSDRPLNINGRICVFFSLFWGFLAIYLMTYLNPRIDKLIDYIKSKLSYKALKLTVTAVIIFLFIDFLATGYALKAFFVRFAYEKHVNLGSEQAISEMYESIYGNEARKEFILKYWGDKKMLKTFPNLKTTDVDGNIVYIDYYYPEITPYYFKIADKK